MRSIKNEGHTTWRIIYLLGRIADSIGGISPVTLATLLVWFRLAQNEGHFTLRKVTSVEEEHCAEEEIASENATNQIAEM